MEVNRLQWEEGGRKERSVPLTEVSCVSGKFSLDPTSSYKHLTFSCGSTISLGTEECRGESASNIGSTGPTHLHRPDLSLGMQEEHFQLWALGTHALKDPTPLVGLLQVSEETCSPDVLLSYVESGMVILWLGSSSLLLLHFLYLLLLSFGWFYMRFAVVLYCSLLLTFVVFTCISVSMF